MLMLFLYLIVVVVEMKYSTQIYAAVSVIATNRKVAISCAWGERKAGHWARNGEGHVQRIRSLKRRRDREHGIS